MNFIIGALLFRALMPLYLLIAGWLVAWLLAFIASRLIIGDGKKAWADVAAYQAWELGLGLHMLAALGTMAWLAYDAFKVGAWLLPEARIYLVGYATVVMIDSVLFAVLLQQKRAAETAVSA